MSLQVTAFTNAPADGTLSIKSPATLLSLQSAGSFQGVSHTVYALEDPSAGTVTREIRIVGPNVTFNSSYSQYIGFADVNTTRFSLFAKP